MSAERCRRFERMKSNAGRTDRRSELIHRRREKIIYDSVEEGFQAIEDGWKRENLLAAALEYIAAAEARAYRVLKRHNLPLELKWFRNSAEEIWRPISEWDKSLGRPIQFSNSYKAIESVTDFDSELGFAGALLEHAHMTRCRLRDADVSTLRAFLDGAALAEDVAMLRLEFGMANLIAPARLQAAGRLEGGARTAAIRKSQSRKRRARWKEEAACLGPNLSARRRSQLVAQRVKGTPFEAAASTIRRALADFGADADLARHSDG